MHMFFYRLDIFTAQEARVKYNQQHYKEVFHDKESVQQIDDSITEPSLLDLVIVSGRTALP